MKYSKVLLGVAMAAAMVGANAANIEHTKVFDLDDGTGSFKDKFTASNVNKSFLDTFTFTIDAASVIEGSTSSNASVVNTKTLDLNITSFGLYQGSKLVSSGVQQLTGTSDYWSLNSGILGAGTYSFKVGGTVLGNGGGAFSGNTNVTPVPEPETWSMVATSLAALGFISRRRKSKASRAA